MPHPQMSPPAFENLHGRFLVALGLRRRLNLPVADNYLRALGNHLVKAALLEEEIAGETLP
jgi:hypothetical protein